MCIMCMCVCVCLRACVGQEVVAQQFIDLTFSDKIIMEHARATIFTVMSGDLEARFVPGTKCRRKYDSDVRL